MIEKSGNFISFISGNFMVTLLIWITYLKHLNLKLVNIESKQKDFTSVTFRKMKIRDLVYTDVNAEINNEADRL